MNSGNVNAGTVAILLEFLEVAVHNILYIRKLYPESIFVPKKKYGVTVYQAIHPEVTRYIKECLKAADFHVRKHQLRKLLVCFENNDVLLERFVVDILAIKDFCESDAFLVELEQSLRAFMLKLHSAQIYLSSILSSDATFSIRLETTNISSLEFNDNPSYEDFPWIEQSASQELSEDSMSIVPIHSVETDSLKLQFYAEK